MAWFLSKTEDFIERLNSTIPREKWRNPPSTALFWIAIIFSNNIVKTVYLSCCKKYIAPPSLFSFFMKQEFLMTIVFKLANKAPPADLKFDKNGVFEVKLQKFINKCSHLISNALLLLLAWLFAKVELIKDKLKVKII